MLGFFLITPLLPGPDRSLKLKGLIGRLCVLKTVPSDSRVAPGRAITPVLQHSGISLPSRSRTLIRVVEMAIHE